MAKQSTRAENSGQTERLARIRAVFLWIVAAIALCGLADAAYLTVAHLSGVTSICGESHGCSVVLGSPYASFRGIPTAAFGGIAYFAAFSAAILALFGYSRARTFLGLVVVVMFLATLWFVYLQAFVLHAFCPFCLLSAGCTFFMAGLLLAYPPGR
jgi:uncharacterized membrane protein